MKTTVRFLSLTILMSLSLFLKQSNAQTVGIVSTFAGSGSYGSANGTGTAAQFDNPTGVVMDASGNVFVADGANNKIRKITPAGVVTTFAGSGATGSANGTGTAASFNWPFAIAINATGTLYVADYNGQKIRKITSAGVVTTLAGSGTSGSADGTGSGASFSYTTGLAVDASGNVYVVDYGNRKIRKITPAGVVTTLAGSGASGGADGTGTAATFNSPIGIAVDASGNAYVTDNDNRKIRKITPAGVVTTFAGSGANGSADGTGTAATFAMPYGITIDGSGNLFITDLFNYKIRKITPAGVVTTIAGSGASGSADGIGSAASFSSPYSVTTNSSGTLLYVADKITYKIRKVTIKLTQNITGLSNLTKVNTDPAFTLSGVASSGLVVSYGSSNTAVATVSGTTVTITGLGTTTITATQAGDGSYAPTTVNITLTVTTPTGINNGYNVSLNVYPNPATEIINIPLSGEKHIRIYDLSGKLIIEEITTTEQLEINELPDGLYILEIEQEGKKYSSRLMKK